MGAILLEVWAQVGSNSYVGASLLEVWAQGGSNSYVGASSLEVGIPRLNFRGGHKSVRGGNN